jgi:S-DNA-T family DNA segregation ATPase FtsK/SpoIIIE
MLYMSSDSSKLVRLQGCYVSDGKIERLTRFWRRASLTSSESEADTRLALGIPEPLIQAELWEQMADPKTGPLAPDRDELWDEALAVVREHRTASTSFLQRKLRIGYSRAARLMDSLEEAGLIGPAQGNAPREVLVGEGDAEARSFEAALDAAFEDDEPPDGPDEPIRPWLPG